MTTTTADKPAIYLRISHDPSGKKAGVTRQREECLALCAARGWGEPLVYTDNDISASKGKRRPAYEAMLADIREGKISAVVAWDLDRLHRRPVELEAFMCLADEKHLALATASGDVDVSTPQGRMIARIKGTVAAHEVEHKAERHRIAAKHKAQSGKPQWRRAFGYLDSPQGPVPDPKTAHLVRQAYAAVLAGGSISDVARTFNAEGAHGLNGKPWTASTASLFLRKPRNAGLRDHNDELVRDKDGNPVKGTWQPLVDEQVWWEVQAILRAPERRPGGHTAVKRHLLTGVVHCGKCENGKLAGMQVDRGRTSVYRCKACYGTSIRAHDVEQYLLALVAARLARPDAVDLLKAEAQDATEAEELRTEANTLRARLDGLAVDYAEGLMTAQQVKVATAHITEKLAAIEAKHQDADKVRLFMDLPLGTDEVVDAVAALSPDRLRAVLATLMDVTVGPVGKGARASNGERVDAAERVQVVWK
ncbi:recombinase family protein [Gordonia insulae]|uniref:Serine recombinase n=1 Tax=Gordonia insulae TaxID=2420509 RepID=A0A3G8JJM8_9ACTN|nr:recombinase family protein [Gordonia insulae]AZG44825.1 hypothetical protein D7316_01416 [Gordonia insulae]